MATEIKRNWTRLTVPLLGALLLALYVWHGQVVKAAAPQPLAYSDFLAAVDDDRVEQAEVHDTEILAKLRSKDGKPAGEAIIERIPNVTDEASLARMEAHKVKITGSVDKTSPWTSFLVGVLPFLILPIAFWLFFVRRAGGATTRPMSFGKSQAKIYDKSKENGVTFADVAGVDEAKGELTEVVSFLKQPAKYTAVGARVPKGVLLVGRLERARRSSPRGRG